MFDISDIQLLPIMVALALPLAGVIIFFLFKVMMKEKTYEEALAEQRILTNELLGINHKPKEKKSKKVKKSKEKQIEESPTTTTELENTSDETDVHENGDKQTSKPHVEFREEAQEVTVSLDSIPVVPPLSKKRAKKVRPILVKKDNPLENSMRQLSAPVEVQPANNFEQIHPKDEFELLRANSHEDFAKSEPTKEKRSKEKKQPSEPSKEKKQPVEAEQSNTKKAKQEKAAIKSVEVPPPPPDAKNVEKVAEPATVQQNNEAVVNSGKEKKKKKSENYTKQQLALEGDQLIPLVRKAELSRTEIQNLIDLLLNKQLGAPEVSSEWSEGKSDPIQKLKKQLAEKEKLLAEEQEALLGAQTKLKEIRTEQQSEKSQLQQKIRSYEEALQQKQMEIQAANNRTQVNSQKIHQLQAQLNEELMTKHKIIEDNTALQMQRQQLEARVIQMQETDGIISKLTTDNEDLVRQNQDLSREFQRLSQEIAVEKEHQHNFVLQLTTKQSEVEQLSEHTRQLEEARKELERKLEISFRQENDWKTEISKMNTALKQTFEEKRRLELSLNEELRLLHMEKSDSERTIIQLKQELQKLRDEKSAQINGTARDSKEHEIKVLNLTNELTSLKSDLSSVNTKFLETEKNYKKELQIVGDKVVKLQSELEEQKEKNNELRKKNWKVMEALSAAESKAKATVPVPNKQKDVDLDKIILDTRNQEQESQKKFIQRLFPEIQQSLENITSTDWQDQCSVLIKNHISNLQKEQTRLSPPESKEKSSEVLKLQVEVSCYKKAIDELEDVLASLQSRVEIEEREWQEKLDEKTAKIEGLQNLLLDLQAKIVKLEKKISHLESDNKKLDEDNQELKQHLTIISNKPEIKSVHVDATATIEKLSEEVNRLREQLRVEQSKSDDLNICSKAHNNSNSSNGSSHLEGGGDS